MNERMKLAHMRVAETYAGLSYARRLKVGCIIVKDDRIISIGYNGTPSGWDNNCEDEIYVEELAYLDQGGPGMPIGVTNLLTKPEVIHAEANAIAKLARSSESGEGASMFITHAPCMDCAKMIFTSGVKNVFYRESYRQTDGIDFLEKCNLHIEKVPYEIKQAHSYR
jgi:dCMP deaminase